MQNIWFKFKATATQIDVRVVVGSGKGTLYAGIAKLYSSSGQLVATSRPGSNDKYQLAIVQLNTLSPGSNYYFSVDQNGGREGTFTLQVNDAYGNDDKANAIELQHLASWRSSNQQFTTVGATADASVAGGNICVNFINNVWFKFKALSSKVTVKIQTGGDLGTIKSPYLMIVDENNMAVNCTYGAGSLAITNNSLTKDSWYYIAVDNTGYDNMGTFTICLEGGPEASALCDNIYCDVNGGVGIGPRWCQLDIECLLKARSLQKESKFS